MKTKETWTIQELHDHSELVNYSVDLEVFVEYLVDKGYIKIAPLVAKNELIFHRHYKVNIDALL